MRVPKLRRRIPTLIGFLRKVAFQLMGSFHVLPEAASDILPWLALANEVEHLFGSMLGFDAILARKIMEKRAYCVRSSANRLAGAMLLGGSDSGYWIRWLAVSSASRGRGIGTALVTTALKAFPPRSSVYVDTFVDDTLDGRAARRLYERSGFTPLSVVCDGGVQRLRYFRETPSSEANLLSHKS